MYEMNTNSLIGIADKLLLENNVELQEFGKVLKNLANEIGGYLQGLGDLQENSKLIQLETQVIKAENENLRMMLITSVKLLELVPNFQGNQKILSFVSETNAYLKGGQ